MYNLFPLVEKHDVETCKNDLAPKNEEKNISPEKNKQNFSPKKNIQKNDALQNWRNACIKFKKEKSLLKSGKDISHPSATPWHRPWLDKATTPLDLLLEAASIKRDEEKKEADRIKRDEEKKEADGINRDEEKKENEAPKANRKEEEKKDEVMRLQEKRNKLLEALKREQEKAKALGAQKKQILPKIQKSWSLSRPLILGKTNLVTASTTIMTSSTSTGPSGGISTRPLVATTMPPAPRPSQQVLGRVATVASAMNTIPNLPFKKRRHQLFTPSRDQPEIILPPKDEYSIKVLLKKNKAEANKWFVSFVVEDDFA